MFVTKDALFGNLMKSSAFPTRFVYDPLVTEKHWLAVVRFVQVDTLVPNMPAIVFVFASNPRQFWKADAIVLSLFNVDRDGTEPVIPVQL